MLKANELRVGNILSIYSVGTVPIDVVDIECIQKQNFGTLELMEDAYEGVQLDSDVLREFGFSSQGGVYFKATGGLFSKIGDTLALTFSGKKFQIILCGKGTNLSVQYLHELQNLYFGLTQEELKNNKKEVV